MLEEEIYEGVKQIVWRQVTIRWDFCQTFRDVQGGRFHRRLSSVVELRSRLGSILNNLLLLGLVLLCLVLLLHIRIPMHRLHRRRGRRQRVGKVGMLRGRSRERRCLLLDERRALYPGKVAPQYLSIVKCSLVTLVGMIALVALLRGERGLKDARMRLQNVFQPVQPLLEFASVAGLLVLVAWCTAGFLTKTYPQPGLLPLLVLASGAVATAPAA